VVLFNDEETSIVETAREIGAVGESATVVIGDVSVEEDCQRVVGVALEHFGSLRLQLSRRSDGVRIATSPPVGLAGRRTA
jgi:hypothetical protein